MRVGLFGFPGSGKGTQAKHVSQRWLIPHISTGDIFRDLKKGHSDFAKKISNILDSGQLVADSLVTKITFDRLSQQDCKKGFVLDGFPRTLEQARALQDSKFALQAFFSLDVDRSEIIRRLSGRRVCGSCKAVYNIEFLKEEVCPKDGAVLQQRPDDSIESIKTRLELFQINYEPLLKYYEEKNLLFLIDGSGPEDVVFSRLKSQINTIFRLK